jgi:hypothetical protein
MVVNPAGGGITDPVAGTHVFEVGTECPLTATANPGWQFVNWTGDVVDANSAQTVVLMDEDQTVTANFELIPLEVYTLSMAVNPSKGGTTDPAAGDHDYDVGTEVKITAIANPGWEFSKWIGDVADPKLTETTVTMDADKEVIAKFCEIPRLAVDPDTQYVVADAGTTTFDIKSNISWAVTETEDWLSITPVEGHRDGLFTVTFDENLSIEGRIGKITVSGRGLSVDVFVNQAGADPYLTAEPANRDVGFLADTTTFDIKSNISWKVSESEDWLSVTPVDGKGDGTLAVIYDENILLEKRIGKLTVSGGGLILNLTVTQAGAVAYLTVEPANQEVGAKEGKTTFDVKSNISWLVTETEKWLKVVPAEGIGDGLLTVSFDKNCSIDKRIGKISITGDGLTVDVTVTQAGAKPYLTVEPVNRDVGHQADTTTFDIKSNIPWIVSENEEWLSVSPVDGKGKSTLTVLYDENSLLDKRIGKLTVSGEGLSVEVTVTQAGANAYLTAEPANRDVDQNEGKTTFDVKSNISWIVSESEDWLSVTPEIGKGDGVLIVAYDKNSSVDKRVGKLTLSGDGLSVDLTVTQSSTKPYLTAEPANRDVGHKEGKTTFDVTSNISWTISESEDWLSVTPVEGKGDGILTVAYDKNCSIDKRVGKLTLSGGGLTVDLTVTQTGENVYLTAEPANRDVDHKESKTTFDVKSNISWTVSESETWLSVVPAEGKGDGTLTVAYDKNRSVDKRIGKLSLSGDGIKVELTVTQAGAKPYLTAEPANQNVSYLADTTTFEIKSNLSWKVSENEDWLSVTPGEAKGKGIIKVAYDGNSSVDKRVGKLTVTGDGLTVDVTVTQAGENVYLTAEPEKQDVDYEAGKTSFDIKSNMAWTVTESVDWLNISPATGSGDGILAVEYDENSEKECRSGHILITGNGIETKVTVRQKGAPCLTVTPPLCSIGSETSDTTLVISSNLEWTVEVSESWVTITPMSGSGDEELSIHCEENTESGPRTAIIIIKSGDLNVEVEVSQSGVTSLANAINQIPTEYRLNQNYPNPFNPSTTIGFTLPEASNVTLEVYNTSGQIITTLVTGNLKSGYHSIVWDADHMPSGVYFYRLTAAKFQDIKKMILTK